MKKLFLYVFLGLLLGSNAFAATVEDFKCTPKETSQKEQAKKDFNFKLISTQSEKQKFVTYNNKENVAMAWIYNEELLKQKMKITGYKSYTEWTTYEFNDYLPEEYTVTNFIMSERKKDGRLILAGSILITSEYYHKEFSELEKLRNEHKNNEEKYFKMFKKDTSRIYGYFEKRWNSQAKGAKIAWDCNKQSSPSDSQSISIDPDDINYKKTILNNKIVGTFKDIANHEWIFKDDGTRLYDVYSIPSLERIHSSSDCWIPKKNYRILEYKECDSNEILGTMQFSFEDMGLIVNTRHGELLIYKLIEPIKIIYEIQHEWTKVQKTNSGRVGYVDLVNLKKDGDHMYYWDLIDYGKPDQYGDSSNTVYWKVNCITLASKMIKQLFYKGPMATGAGKSIPLKSHQKGWVAVGPGTFGDKAARMVCKKKYDM